jgi:outer membrane protein assembly factor BamB
MKATSLVRRLPLLLLSLATPLAAQSAMFRGDPRHSGVYPAPIGPQLQGLQWRYETQGSVVGSAAVLGDTVWIGSSDGVMVALDRVTGSARWTADLGSPIASSPAVFAGRVFVGTRDGQYHALESGSGRRLWSASTGPDLRLHWGHESGDVYTSSPVVDGDLVFAGSGDGGVFAFEAATGKRRWRARTGGRVRSSPAVDGDRVYVGSGDGIFYCLDRGTGRERWRYATLGATLESGHFGYDRRTIQSSPLVVDGTVYFGARDGFLYAVSADSGQLRWKFDHRISWVNSSPVLAGGLIYVGSSDGQFVQGVRAATGAEVWRTNVENTVWSSASVAGDLVLIGDGGGHVRALDRETGARRWVFTTGAQVWATPVIAGSLVITGSGDGGVYALRVGPDSVQREVYFDTTGVIKAAPPEITTAQAFIDRGYRVLQTAELIAFLQDRVRDRAPSVVVFALEHLPPEIVTAPLTQSLFRRYLEAGGKVVWNRLPPLLYPRDATTGQRSNKGLSDFQWDAPGRLLGGALAGQLFDQRTAVPTAQGRRWGLTGRWRDAWSIAPESGVEVLALDDWSMAAAWVRPYGGEEGTGFVRGPTDDLRQLYLLAEYRPSAQP